MRHLRPLVPEDLHPAVLARRSVVSIVRACIAQAQTKLGKGADEFVRLRARWPEETTASLVLRAASSPHALPDAALGQSIVSDLLTVVGATGAGARLLQSALTLIFDQHAQVFVPGLLLSDLAPPPFVGQGAPIPVIDGLATSVTLGPHKMASIVVATSEMLAASNAERIVGNALTRAVALSIDNVLFDAQPADAVRPAGLRHGIAVIAASSNPYVREAMVADLAVLANEVAPIGGPITYIAAPGRAATINLWATRELPYAVLASPALAATDLICVATDGLASAVSGVPSIDASKYATLALNDPGVVVLSAPTMSMFQADTVGIRVRFDISWGLRSAKALAWLSATKW